MSSPSPTGTESGSDDDSMSTAALVERLDALQRSIEESRARDASMRDERHKLNNRLAVTLGTVEARMLEGDDRFQRIEQWISKVDSKFERIERWITGDKELNSVGLAAQVAANSIKIDHLERKVDSEVKEVKRVVRVAGWLIAGGAGAVAALAKTWDWITTHR